MNERISRILLPTDLSETSLQARPLADALAERFGAEVEILHVVEELPYEIYLQRGLLAGSGETPSSDRTAAEQRDRFWRQLNEGLWNHLEFLAGQGHKPCKSKVREGRPVDEILAEVAQYAPQIVVMCTHGRTGWRRLAMGSVTEQIVRLSPVPVLTVHATPTD